MRIALATIFRMRPCQGASSGFTIIETVIAMLVAGMALMAAYTSYNVQQKAFSVEREAARMEANLRAAMNVIKSDLRNSGRCEAGNESTCGFRFLVESKRYDFRNGALDMASVAGIQRIVMQMAQDQTDENGKNVKDGKADTTPWGAPVRTITYTVQDTNADGIRELRRVDTANPGGSTLVANGIYDMAFAFAYDNENNGRGDGRLDRLAPVNPADPSTIIWASVSDADGGNRLDQNLDTVPDRVIDYRDDGDGDNEINGGDGGVLNPTVPLNKARAVRIWLLARSIREYPGDVDNQRYQVGHRTFIPSDNKTVAIDNDNDGVDRHRYLLMESSVRLRNTERSGR